MAWILIFAASCTEAAQTSSATQSLGSGDDDDGRVASVHVRLASGGDFKLTATQLQPDPIYMIFGGLNGEATTGRHNTFEVRSTVSGPLAGPTLATGIAAVTAVMTNNVTGSYASGALPSESLSLSFTKISSPYDPITPADAAAILQVGNAAAALAGGSDGAQTMKVLSAPFGLPDPCASSQCGRLQVTYSTVANGEPTDQLQIVVRDLNGTPVDTGLGTPLVPPGVPNAAVSVCFQGPKAPPPQTVITDANGVAVTAAPVGVAIGSVIVTAVLDDSQVVCSKGSVSCGGGGGGDGPPPIN